MAIATTIKGIQTKGALDGRRRQNPTAIAKARVAWSLGNEPSRTWSQVIGGCPVHEGPRSVDQRRQDGGQDEGEGCGKACGDGGDSVFSRADDPDHDEGERSEQDRPLGHHDGEDEIEAVQADGRDERGGNDMVESDGAGSES